MISVLIVDDEYLIRKLVRNSIEWDALQMEVVGEAENGQEAIRFLTQHPVDIAIVDINMPFVNGIAFAEYVYKNHLQTKVILLTGYREFEYARQAIQWKVFDYMLKPLQISELEKTLRSIATSYYRSKNKLSPREERMAQLRDFANGITDQVPENCRDMRNFYALVFRIDRAQRLDGLRGELIYLCDSATRYISEKLSLRCERYVEYDSYVVLFVGTGNAVRDEGERIRLADTLREQIRLRRGYTMTAGISNTFQKTEELRVALQEALDAVSNRFYLQSNRTYTAQEIVKLAYNSKLNISSQVNGLLAEAGDSAKTDKQVCYGMLRDLLDGFEAERVNEDYVKMTMLQCLLTLYATRNEGKGHGTKPIYQIMNYEQFADFREALEGIFRSILEYENSRENRSVALSSLTTRVCQYIDEQFADRDISLNTIAASVYANPTYISNQFKKEMGLTITEYITACRMKKAQQLISTGAKSSLQEIADAVGYNDPYYFSKSFKKFYGNNPVPVFDQKELNMDRNAVPIGDGVPV